MRGLDGLEEFVMYELLQPYFTMIALVLIAIFVLVLAVVIFKSLNSRVRGRKGSRLGISEYYELDKDRRLVLIRRDDVEHLLLVGGNQELVIESGVPSAMISQPMIPPPPQEPLLRNAPRPAVFGGTRPTLRPVTQGYNPNDPNS
jgi:flagellar biogenesis protein FliO